MLLITGFLIGYGIGSIVTVAGVLIIIWMQKLGSQSDAQSKSSSEGENYGREGN